MGNINAETITVSAIFNLLYRISLTEFPQKYIHEVWPNFITYPTFLRTVFLVESSRLCITLILCLNRSASTSSLVIVPNKWYALWIIFPTATGFFFLRIELEEEEKLREFEIPFDILELRVVFESSASELSVKVDEWLREVSSRYEFWVTVGSLCLIGFRSPLITRSCEVFREWKKSMKTVMTSVSSLHSASSSLFSSVTQKF